MIKIGTTTITMPSGISKVYVGENLVWPMKDHDLIVITRNDYAVGWTDGNSDNVEVGYRRKELPSGYTECEYNTVSGGVEGSTGWKTNGTSIIEAKVYRAEAPPVVFFMWLTSTSSSAGNGRVSAAFGAGGGTWRFGSQTLVVSTPDIVGAPVTLRQDITGAYVNNQLYTAYNNPTVTTSGQVLKWGSIASSSGDPSEIRYYYFMHIRDGIIRTYYIPCIRNSDNASGFYNIASDTFVEMGTAGPVK